MNYRDYGRIGGLQTSLRYGQDYMKELGRRGGLARRLSTLSELRQQSAPKTENKLREGMVAQPNNLRVLKELWKLRNKNGGLGRVAAPCPPERSGIEVQTHYKTQWESPSSLQTTGTTG